MEHNTQKAKFKRLKTPDLKAAIYLPIQKLENILPNIS